MLDVLGADYIRTARAKGLAEHAVVIRHALKNALLPVVTVLALQLGTLVGGTFVIEQVFAWPGIGRLSLTAIQHRDYAVIQAVVLLVAAALRHRQLPGGPGLRVAGSADPARSGALR